MPELTTGKARGILELLDAGAGIAENLVLHLPFFVSGTEARKSREKPTGCGRVAARTSPQSRTRRTTWQRRGIVRGGFG